MDIKKAIENGIDNISISCMQSSGMRVYYNPDAPAGSRITSMRSLDGKMTEPDKYYTVVNQRLHVYRRRRIRFQRCRKWGRCGIPIRNAFVEGLREAKSLSLTYENYAIDSHDHASANLPETNSST